MRAVSAVLGALPGQQPLVWIVADAVAVVLVVVNVALIAIVLVRRMRRRAREHRAGLFRARFEALLAESGPGTGADPNAVHALISRLDSFERPIAGSLLIERLLVASPAERAQTLAWAREIGGLDVLLRSSRRWTPWRRAMAVRVLGLVGADEAVPMLIARLSDRNRYVRDAAVRALGRIGDRRALPMLAELHTNPGRVAPGLTYEALLAFRSDAVPVFVEGLRSSNEHVRIASVYGIGTVSEPESARTRLEQIMADGAPSVRAAAAEMLGRLGGASVPEELARASRDEHRAVRRAAVSALATYDDPRSLQLALSALDDPDRDTAIRAGETLVCLTRLPDVGTDAKTLTATAEAWPLDRARVLASLGMV